MWWYESDGETTWCGKYIVAAPKTHYITNGEERIDCQSEKEARKLERELNERNYREAVRKR